MKAQRFDRKWPVILLLGVILADQLTKLWIVKSIPLNTVGWQMWGGFFRIIHVRNLGIAFSMGNGLPDFFRSLLFIILPLAVLLLLFVFYLRERSMSTLQGWAVAGIIGGGLGNIIDRIFRPAGVVDFLDVKFYGLFGLERFPTFNVADASVVVCGILLILSHILEGRATRSSR